MLLLALQKWYGSHVNAQVRTPIHIFASIPYFQIFVNLFRQTHIRPTIFHFAIHEINNVCNRVVLLDVLQNNKAH